MKKKIKVIFGVLAILIGMNCNIVFSQVQNAADAFQSIIEMDNRLAKENMALKQKVQDLQNLISMASPVGSIILWASPYVPEGFLLCDGRELEVDEYRDLYEVLGNTYGEDSKKFRLPDTRGLFIRGVGGNSEALGVIQKDAIRNIHGKFGRVFDDKKGTGAFSTSDKIFKASCGSCVGFYDTDFDASRVVPTANENRPVNMALNYIIKY